ARKAEEVMRTPEPVVTPAPVLAPVEMGNATKADEDPASVEPVVAAFVDDSVADQAPVEEVETAAAPGFAPDFAADFAADMDSDLQESQLAAEPEATDELLLTPHTMVDEPVAGNPVPPVEDEVELEEAGSRSWLTPQTAAEDEKSAPKIAQSGGTLFERMSNIARGVAKADQDEGAKDPLDIPRFLNRQNNQ
ncbi:MAG: hypothetical protein RL367_186, partial [Pseudomonadota bacterium]